MLHYFRIIIFAQSAVIFFGAVVDPHLPTSWVILDTAPLGRIIEEWRFPTSYFFAKKHKYSCILFLSLLSLFFLFANQLVIASIHEWVLSSMHINFVLMNLLRAVRVIFRTSSFRWVNYLHNKMNKPKLEAFVFYLQGVAHRPPQKKSILLNFKKWYKQSEKASWSSITPIFNTISPIILYWWVCVQHWRKFQHRH